MSVENGANEIAGGKGPVEGTEEDRSKDIFFEKIGDVADEMIAAHGKEFAMGVLVLAARFIAEGRPLSASGKKED